VVHPSSEMSQPSTSMPHVCIELVSHGDGGGTNINGIDVLDLTHNVTNDK
jgi:hypothetical protein